ncbi:MAG: hypothetical protein AAF514_01440 [Verrucomicrobiota bacterium]
MTILRNTRSGFHLLSPDSAETHWEDWWDIVDQTLQSEVSPQAFLLDDSAGSLRFEEAEVPGLRLKFKELEKRVSFLAFVTTNDFGFGLARMAELQNDGGLVLFRVFRQKKDAEKWIRESVSMP